MCTRLAQQHLKKYQDSEIVEILEKTAPGLSADKRKSIAQEFFKERQAAIDICRSKPGLRYLQQRVEEAHAKPGEKEMATPETSGSSIRMRS